MDESIAEVKEPSAQNSFIMRFDIGTQTLPEMLPLFGEGSCSCQADLPPEINGIGPTLLSQYHKTVDHYLNKIDLTQLSTYRQEIASKLFQNIIFQSNVFGTNPLNYDTLPRNTFTSFTASLLLTIYDDHFSFSTVCPGYEQTGDLNNDFSNLLFYLSKGILPPKTLEILRKLALTWYDGGLICEIVRDGSSILPLRIYLSANPDDIVLIGNAREQCEIEREFLLAKYPQLCLEPDIQVSRLARAAEQDRARWTQQKYYPQTPMIFMKEVYPRLFFEDPIPPPAPTPAPEIDAEELRQRLAKKLSS